MGHLTHGCVISITERCENLIPRRDQTQPPTAHRLRPIICISGSWPVIIPHEWGRIRQGWYALAVRKERIATPLMKLSPSIERMPAGIRHPFVTLGNHYLQIGRSFLDPAAARPALPNSDASKPHLQSYCFGGSSYDHPRAHSVGKPRRNRVLPSIPWRKVMLVASGINYSARPSPRVF